MNILILDDEEMQRNLLQGFLEKQNYKVLSAADGKSGLALFMEHPVELVLLDHRMPDMNGDEVLARMKEINPGVRAIIITAFAAVGMAVRVMQLGADDFLEKPVDLAELLAKIHSIEDELLVAEDVEAVEESLELEDLPVRLVGHSQAIRNVLSIVRRAAPAPWTVLIRGETGTGKELIARLIHLLSPRKDQPFIELNCAAVPETCLNPSCSATKKGLLPVPQPGVEVFLNWQTAAPCSWMRLANSRRPCRPNCCGPSRNIPFPGWAAKNQSPSMCVLWQPPTVI